MDIMRDTLYVVTMILRVIAYIQQTKEIAKNPNIAFIPREEWNSFDPQLISEGLFAAANILSALKLVHIFSINPYLGPLQISLGRMVIDIVKFFFIYTLVLFAFACGLTQLLWYYNDLERNKCYSLPGGEPDWFKQGDACMRWRRFYNLFESSQSLFWASFGMVSLEDFELTGIREYTRFWSMLMFGAYSVINVIVLLNLLIAMMSSSYSFIVEHADTEWKFARTKLWMSYFEEGNTLPPPFNILPTPKGFLRLCGKSSKKQELIRQLSARTQHRRRRACDYRYLSVMRALIWRYVCALQRRNEERPVNEDDISEVKGDISSLRFELVDLFSANGMDVSMCAKKSRAALGRKMRVWERRLMRDFHVSPAMGSESALGEPIIEPKTAKDKFKRAVQMAMSSATTALSNVAVDADQLHSTQIGTGDDQAREHLQHAMERALKKMEQCTPDGSPGSSRGCSPYPDLYTGPHLLDAIKNLDLSPSASPSESPLPSLGSDSKPWSPIRLKDGQAKDLTKLTVPGRLSPHPLKKTSESVPPGVSLEVPANIFSKDSMKKTAELKKNGDGPSESKKKEQVRTNGSKPPVTVTTVSESTSPQPKKDEAKVQKKSPPIPKGVPQEGSAIKPSQVKTSGVSPISIQPVKKDAIHSPVTVPTVSETTSPPLKKDEDKVQKESQPMPTGVPQDGLAMKPSQVKASGFSPINIQPGKPAHKEPGPLPGKILPPAVVGPRRGPESEQGIRRQAPTRFYQVQEQTFTGSEGLENIDFVRRPIRSVPKQDSREDKRVLPDAPIIAVTPSTPAPPDTPGPHSPTLESKLTPSTITEKSPLPTATPAEKPKLSAPAKAVDLKPVALKPTQKPEDPKPSVKSEAPKPVEKAEAPKPTEKLDVAKPAEKAEKSAAPKPSDKPAAPKPAGSQEQKPSTPPAAAFQSNVGTNQSEPLINPPKSKKGNWL